jgi:hypothetical protein
MEEFRVSYGVDDGYIGSGKQSFTIRGSDIEEDMSEDALKDLFWDMIQEDFEQNVHPVSYQEDEFIKWAKGIISSRADEEV